MMVERVFLVGVLTAAAVVAVTAPAADAAGPYRRWTTPKPFVCATTPTGVEVQLANQDVEFGGGLPAEAQFTISYIRNGVESTDGPFPVEQTSGTRSNGAFAEAFASYPFTFDIRLDTIIDSTVVYSSSLPVACTADTTGSVFASNESATPDPYRRWISPKSFECETTGDGVAIVLGEQDVEFNELPPGATYTIDYVRNGVVTTDGPFPVEQPSGTRSYAAFADSFAAYPFTFEVRLNTLVGGTVVYRSTLSFACGADVQGTVSATNAIVPPPTSSTSSSTTTSSTTTSSTSSTSTTTTTTMPTTSSSSSTTSSTSSTTSSTVAGGAATTTTIRRPTTTIRRTTTTIRRRHPAAGAPTGPTSGIALLLIGVGTAMLVAVRRRSDAAGS